MLTTLSENQKVKLADYATRYCAMFLLLAMAISAAVFCLASG